MITGFDHVHYTSGNIEEMAKYFEKAFGAKEISRAESRGFPMIRMNAFGTTISFIGTDAGAGQLETGTGKRGLDHIGFSVKNMEETLDDLKKKGVQVLSGPSVTPAGVKIAFVGGPEGIRIELVERD